VDTYLFKNLQPTTPYNVTVEGGSGGRLIWHITKIFQTIDKGKLRAPPLAAGGFNRR
jgi:hypothetical protein